MASYSHGYLSMDMTEIKGFFKDIIKVTNQFTLRQSKIPDAWLNQVVMWEHFKILKSQSDLESVVVLVEMFDSLEEAITMLWAMERTCGKDSWVASRNKSSSWPAVSMKITLVLQLQGTNFCQRLMLLEKDSEHAFQDYCLNYACHFILFNGTYPFFYI